MKYVKQVGIIIIVSFLAEILNQVIPIPVPASIYGLVLMLAGLITGIIPYEEVREVGHFWWILWRSCFCLRRWV